MALLIIGGSKCAICEKTIDDPDDATGFPNFLPNWHHLFRFSDAPFHISCLKVWQYRTEFLDLFERTEEIREKYELRKPNPPNSIKNFSQWYDNSPEVRNYFKKLDQELNLVFENFKRSEPNTKQRKADE